MRWRHGWCRLTATTVRWLAGAWLSSMWLAGAGPAWAGSVAVSGTAQQEPVGLSRSLGGTGGRPGPARKCAEIAKEAAAVPSGDREGVFRLSRELGSATPQDEADMEALRGLGKDARYERTVAAAIRSLPAPVPSAIRTELFAVVNDKKSSPNWGLLDAALEVLLKDNGADVVPGLRGALKAIRPVPLPDFTAWGLLVAALERGTGVDSQLFRANRIGVALAQTKDPAVLDDLFGRNDTFLTVSSGYWTPFGLGALTRAADIARHERGIRKDKAIEGLDLFPQAECAPLLVELLNDPDPRVRKASLNGLAESAAPNLEPVFERMERDSDEIVRDVATAAKLQHDPVGHKAEILKHIYNTANWRVQSTTLDLVAGGKVPGIEKELEAFIRWSEQRDSGDLGNQRGRAAEGIWRLTCKRIEYRHWPDDPCPWDRPETRPPDCERAKAGPRTSKSRVP